MERIPIPLDEKAASLLARLCADGAEPDPSVLVARALGLYALATHARRQGGRLVVVSDRGEQSEVAL